MPVGVDLGFRARLPDERIVRRHRAIVFETQRLADVIVERLRLHAQAVVIRSVRTQLLRVAADAIAIADRHVEHAVLAEVDAAGNVAACLPRIGDEDLLDVTERGSLQVSARDGERRALSDPASDTTRIRAGCRRTSGCTATKCSESFACPAGVGDVQTGCGASTPLRITRSAPFFSVTRIVLASAKAMPHG